MKTAIFFALFAFAALLACDDNVTTPPSPGGPITVTNPDDGAVLHDSPVIRADAGSGFSFTLVEFDIDGDSVTSDSTFPYEYRWNIFNYQSGSAHTIVALGHTIDTVYVSDTVNVTVQFQSGLTLAGSYSPGVQNAVGVVNYQNALFVSLGDAGLELLNVASRISPEFVSRYNTSGQALHADVQFPYVFVADRDQGVVRLDISDPDSMVLTGSYDSQGLANDVAASGQYLFVADNDALVILRISNPNSLIFISRSSFTPDLLNYIVARNDTAFIVGNTGFYIIDCSNTAAPEVVSVYNANINLANAVAVTDTFVFIANGAEGVMALSIFDPTSPRFLGSFSSGQIMTAVDVGDSALFAGSNSGIVYALDYSVEGSISEIDQLNIVDQVQEIDYQDNYAYVAANLNVYLIRFAR